MLVPLITNVANSFTDLNTFRPSTHWVGLANYRALLDDADFHQALHNTVVLTLIVTILPNVAGLGIAMLLDRSGWFTNALRSVFFVPTVLSAVVVSVVWQKILTDDGLFNRALHAVGVGSPPGWLSDPDLALYSIAFIMSWQVLGFCVVVYLAGLQSIPAELHESAVIDGAGALASFRHVTWPLLAPAVTINTVMLMITGFKAYDYIQVITNGGPGSGTTSTIAFSIVQTAFTGNHVGYAAAMATVMFVGIALLSAGALTVLQRREVTL
ncbi:carbohydrate ABC transporter permease [Yinghuangia seranimata]|uniref:carbohydrate ABC transporter permease n=1 Tax=Yinghuangia seranimata TaxID=408067 RepID=UPI00248ACC12|nr:sugar ABC transporter permease [Yinghuangia seranimata]MDI2129493.1 sugar ABC transporter permease [Yinghuangia seranimata]